MKRFIVLITFIVMTTSVAYGDAYFDTHALSALRVAQVNTENNTARIIDADGASALVGIGDTIGQKAATVIKVTAFHVVVKTEQGTTKIPVIRGTNIGDNRIGFH